MVEEGDEEEGEGFAPPASASAAAAAAVQGAAQAAAAAAAAPPPLLPSAQWERDSAFLAEAQGRGFTSPHHHFTSPTIQIISRHHHPDPFSTPFPASATSAPSASAQLGRLQGAVEASSSSPVYAYLLNGVKSRESAAVQQYLASQGEASHWDEPVALPAPRARSPTRSARPSL